MVEQLGEFICRKAKLKDIPNIHSILEPNVDKEEKGVIGKYLRYYIRLNSCYVIETEEGIVGLYAGKEQFIHYLVNKGGPKSTLLLLYVVLCGIHNRYEGSSFKAFDSNMEMFEKLRDRAGKACIIDHETKVGTIDPITKKYIEQLYRRFKND